MTQGQRPGYHPGKPGGDLPPQVWAAVNVKGGVGKTTTIAGAAAAMSARGRPVTLIDADLDKPDLTDWYATRCARWPALPRLELAQLPRELDERGLLELIDEHVARGRDVLVDVGAGDRDAMRDAMSVAHLVLVPLKPGQFEMYSCARMARRVRECRRWNRSLRAYYVLTECETNKTLAPWNEAAAEACRRYAADIALARTRLPRLIGFKRAAKDGLGVLELVERDPQAADVFGQLMRELAPELAATMEEIDAAQA